MASPYASMGSRGGLTILNVSYRFARANYLAQDRADIGFAVKEANSTASPISNPGNEGQGADLIRGSDFANQRFAVLIRRAHIKSALTNNQISLSIKDSSLLLGMWQGLYLFEHRIKSQKRKIIHHFLGE